MLEQHQIPFRYRDYLDEPLSVEEIQTVLTQLGMGPRDVLRSQDRAAARVGLTGHESDERLIELMAAHPTLLQRPIAVYEGRAALGRPPENILRLLTDNLNWPGP